MEELDIHGPLLVISNDKVPISAYQAIYHRLTSKVEKLSETFSEAYIIKIEDVCHLDNIISQAVAQFQVKGRKCEPVISFRKGESHIFSDFQKFRNFNFSSLNCTNRIVYSYDFFTILPVEIKEAEDIVQRFKVSISIDQDFVEESDDGIPSFVRGMMSGNNINVVIEYSDYSVARNIQSSIRDWVNSLQKEKTNRVTKFLIKQGGFFHFFIPKLFPCGVLFGAAASYSQYVHVNYIFVILFNMALAILSQILGHVLIVQFMGELNLNRAISFILITEGDKRRHKDFMDRKSIRKLVASFLFVTMLGGFIASLFASYIFMRI